VNVEWQLDVNRFRESWKWCVIRPQGGYHGIHGDEPMRGDHGLIGIKQSIPDIRSLRRLECTVIKFVVLENSFGVCHITYFFCTAKKKFSDPSRF
jgi:hypothetical protein